jgi:hypothetical protein
MSSTEITKSFDRKIETGRVPGFVILRDDTEPGTPPLPQAFLATAKASPLVVIASLTPPPCCP